jgi:hypothetical protein
MASYCGTNLAIPTCQDQLETPPPPPPEQTPNPTAPNHPTQPNPTNQTTHPAEEDHPGARPPQALVRRGGDDVGVVKGGRQLLGGDEARDVRHVDEEVRAHLVGDGAEALVVPLGVFLGGGCVEVVEER